MFLEDCWKFCSCQCVTLQTCAFIDVWSWIITALEWPLADSDDPKNKAVHCTCERITCWVQKLHCQSDFQCFWPVAPQQTQRQTHQASTNTLLDDFKHTTQLWTSLVHMKDEHFPLRQVLRLMQCSDLCGPSLGLVSDCPMTSPLYTFKHKSNTFIWFPWRFIQLLIICDWSLLDKLSCSDHT